MITASGVVYGLLAIVIGVLALKFNFQLVNMTGRQDWIESKLGGGSTFFVYKLFAVCIIFGGVLYLTGFGNAFFGWLFSPLRGLFAPPQNTN